LGFDSLITGDEPELDLMFMPMPRKV